jgi:putative transposase
MPYLPRYMIICDDAHFHVTWQCHNKDWLLKWDWAKKLYYNLLLKYKDRYGVDIYSYNLMDNHPHMTGHLQEKEAFSAFFRLVNCLFAKAVNKRLKRRGQVVMDRFKSPRIETDEYMLNAMVYIDLNQYRAGKVSHPKENCWSSYHYYAYGEDDPLITPSPSYMALGKTSKERQKEYRTMVEGLIGTKRRFNISDTYFIGNPDWVIDRYKEFRNALSERYAKYRVESRASPPE